MYEYVSRSTYFSNCVLFVFDAFQYFEYFETTLFS